MDTLHVIILALIQGLTEFLPISSSAHLILFPRLVGWVDQGLSFDIAVHLGTLTAVVAYFRHEIRVVTAAFFRSLLRQQHSPEGHLAWGVLVGTIPVGIAGLLFKEVIETQLRSPIVIAWSTILFGLLLWWAYRSGQRQRDEYSLSWKDILIIGVAQAIALIPGTSRSGITITAGLMVGMSGKASARFSFLLSIPVITIASLLSLKDLLEADLPIDWTAIILGMAISAISAYLCITYFLKLLDKLGMTPFVIYRLLLGAILLIMFV